MTDLHPSSILHGEKLCIYPTKKYLDLSNLMINPKQGCENNCIHKSKFYIRKSTPTFNSFGDMLRIFEGSNSPLNSRRASLP